MKNGNDTHIPADFDRKHGHAHVTNNPPKSKNIPIKEDKRKEVREEHTNHFTSREGYPEKSKPKNK